MAPTPVPTAADSRRPTTDDAARWGPRVLTLGGFAVVVDDVAVEVPTGLPLQALKLVIAQGGRLHAEALMERLWPDTGLAEGRKGIRNILSRLRRAGPVLLERDGEAIRVAEGVWVDAFAFRALADQVLIDPDPTAAVLGARRALALYRGTFLPDDCYVDWTEVPRRQLRRRQVSMFDVLAADARRRGAHLEAIQLLELALEADPLDDVRYLELAELLLATDRRGRAAELIDRSRAVLREHGLLPGAAWARLQRELHQTRRAAGPALNRPMDETA